MKLSARSTALAAAALLFGTAASAGPIAYSLADNGTTLIKFDLTTPGVTTAVGSFSGAVTRIDSIDFRPANDLLYGYSQESNSVVTIDLGTAATTLASVPSTGSATRTLGVDFNPVPDRMRLVTADNDNLRINVANGVTLVDGALAYAAGDVNFGVDPNVVEAAYTNSDRNLATATRLFYIDSNLDVLLSTTAPNAGQLTTIGALGVDTTNLVGFDILADGLGHNVLYALLTDSIGTPSLYTLNSATGAATLIGEVSMAAGGRPLGLAITRQVPGPESASLAVLMAIGVGAAGLHRRRRALGSA